MGPLFDLSREKVKSVTREREDICGIRGICIILDPNESVTVLTSHSPPYSFYAHPKRSRCIIYDSPIASCRMPVTADIFDAECDMENGWVILG